MQQWERVQMEFALSWVRYPLWVLGHNLSMVGVTAVLWFMFYVMHFS
jgi:hypothetical protein